MRVHRGVLPFAIMASRSAQGLPPTTSSTADRTTLAHAALKHNSTSHADRETRDTHMYTCPNGACTFSATSAAQTNGRVSLPLTLAGAGLAALLGIDGLAIPLVLVAFSDSVTAEDIPPSRIPTPEVLTTTSTSPDVDNESLVNVTPVSLTALTALSTASTAFTPDILSENKLSNRATAPTAGGSCTPMNSLACTGDYFLVCSHAGTWTNTGSMGSNYVCEDGVPASTQCSDDSSGDGGADSDEGAAGKSAASITRARGSMKFLLAAALAAGLHGYVVALPLAVLGLVCPAIAVTTSPDFADLASTSLPHANLTLPETLAVRTACSNNGALSCGDGGNTFFLCSEGTLVDMGNVAAGTVCENGVIVAAAGYGGAAGETTSGGIDSGAVGGRRRMGLPLLLVLGGLVVGVVGVVGGVNR